MMRTHVPAAVEILDACECLRLLGTVAIGRLVFTQGGLPVIRLVDFCVEGETTTAGSCSGSAPSH
jgi:uncharacterized protein